MPKITALPTDPAITSDDYVVSVDMAGPTTKKTTWASVVTWLKTQLFPILKANLEPAHYNALFWSTNGPTSGQVVSGQTNVVFDASDTVNGVGITAVTGNPAYLTIARDGIYKINIQTHFTDSTDPNSVIIPWYAFSFDNGTSTNIMRQNDRKMAGLAGQVEQYSMQTFLPAGTRVGLQLYASASTRFGAPGAGGALTAYQAQRSFGTHISVAEIR